MLMTGEPRALYEAGRLFAIRNEGFTRCGPKGLSRQDQHHRNTKGGRFDAQKDPGRHIHRSLSPERSTPAIPDLYPPIPSLPDTPSLAPTGQAHLAWTPSDFGHCSFGEKCMQREERHKSEDAAGARVCPDPAPSHH